LDSERSARVELEARAVAADAKAAELAKSAHDAREETASLEAKLKDHDDQINAFQSGEFYRSSSITQLEARKDQLEHELELRRLDPEPKRPVVPPLPKPGAQTGQAPDSHLPLR
jgi:chromosome segregation ATPase